MTEKKDLIKNDEKVMGRRNSLPQSNAEIRRRKVAGFVQSLQEVHPIVELAKTKAKEIPEFHVEIARLFHHQKRLVKILSSSWSLTNNDFSDAVVLFRLSKMASHILKCGSISLETDEDMILTVSKLLSKITDDRKDLGELMDQDPISNDILVNVKIVLFSSSIRLEKILVGIGISEKERVQIIRWFHQTTVLLGKDLAFNWDKSAQFKDRETLFQQVLPYCADIVIDAWKTNYLLTINSSNSLFNEEEIWEHLNDLSNCINNKDMGYAAHESMNMSWLKVKVSRMILDYINKFSFFDFSEQQQKVIKLYILKKIETLLIDSWNESSDDMIESFQAKFELMSDDEIQRWEKEEGSKPMSFELFADCFNSKISLLTDSFFPVNIDNNKAEQFAKRQLSILWGFSDTVCKLKTK